MKTIYLEPDEEITSVVDILTNAEAKEISLVIPVGAQLLQSSISLKLLKREALNLKKRIIIVTADELGQEIAKKANFEVRDSIDVEEVEDFSPELVEQAQEIEPRLAVKSAKEQKNKEDIIDTLSEEMDIDNSEQFEPEADIATETGKKSYFKSKLARMTDIVRDVKKNQVSEKEEKLEEEIEVPITKPEPEPEIDETEDLPKESTYKIEDLEEEELVELEPEKEFKNLKSKYEANGDQYPDSEDEALEDIQTQEEQDYQKSPSIKPPKTFIKKILTNKFFYITVGIIVVIIGSLIYNNLQSAEIVLTLKTERISFDLDVEGSNDIAAVDAENNMIPIQLLKKPESLSREFEATGEKEIKEKAVGTVTIYNEYSSKAQILVATTRIESPDGLIFRTIETVEIPGASIDEGKIVASVLDIEVEADQAGDKYNIGPSEFTIPGFEGTPKYAGFYGRSKESMSGGRIDRIKIVTEDDLINAKETLSKELLEKELAIKALESQMPQDLKLIKDALFEEIIGSSSTVSADEEANKFRMEVTSQSQAMVFNEQDLDSIVDAHLSKKIEEDRISVPNSKQISWETVVDWENISVKLTLNVKEDIAWQIDTEKVKNELAGLNEIEATKYLRSVKNVQKAKVTFWPFWIKTIPSNTNKIEIIVE